MSESSEENEKIIGRVKPIGMIVLGMFENRPWIELCYDGDFFDRADLLLRTSVTFTYAAKHSLQGYSRSC